MSHTAILDAPPVDIGDMRVALALAEENTGPAADRIGYITRRARAAGYPDGQPILIPPREPKPPTRPGGRP